MADEVRVIAVDGVDGHQPGDDFLVTERQAKQLIAQSERSPRGYIQYLVKPVQARKKRR